MWTYNLSCDPTHCLWGAGCSESSQAQAFVLGRIRRVNHTQVRKGSQEIWAAYGEKPRANTRPVSFFLVWLGLNFQLFLYYSLFPLTLLPSLALSFTSKRSRGQGRNEGVTFILASVSVLRKTLCPPRQLNSNKGSKSWLLSLD